jgi:hypothetical protein
MFGDIRKYIDLVRGPWLYDDCDEESFVTTTWGEEVKEDPRQEKLPVATLSRHRCAHTTITSAIPSAIATVISAVSRRAQTHQC